METFEGIENGKREINLNVIESKVIVNVEKWKRKREKKDMGLYRFFC